MEKYNVMYQGGESRYHAGVGIDYMLVVVDGVELYAEADPFDYFPDDADHDDMSTWPDEFDTATYDDLKADILEQAKENGIDTDCLRFWYDD